MAAKKAKASASPKVEEKRPLVEPTSDIEYDVIKASGPGMSRAGQRMIVMRRHKIEGKWGCWKRWRSKRIHKVDGEWDEQGARKECAGLIADDKKRSEGR